MFCTKCGKQLDDGLKFCTACGAPVTMPEKPEAEAGKAESAGAMEAEAGEHEAAAGEARTAGKRAEAEAMSSDETAVLQPVEEPASAELAGIGDGGVDAEAPTGKPFDLPDSALEPKTPEPTSDDDQRTAMETQAMEPVKQYDRADFRDERPTGSNEPGKPSPKQRRSRVVAISSAAAVAVAVAVAGLLVLDPFNPNAPIDSEAFPNDIIRSAVTSQLDADGDGRLSDEEAALATALVLTPDGAEFVTEGNEVDVQTIRDGIAADAGSAGGDVDAAGSQPGGTNAGNQEASGNDAQEGGNQGEVGQSPFMPAIGDELAPFASLKTLVATGCDLTEVDLSVMPSLEYVDLRDNPGLAAFDLAGNKKIRVLFCDEGTDITGLDEAGLYFTDLVTSMQVLDGSQSSTIQVDYDTHARPVVSNGVAYAYDEQGRLSHAEQTDVEDGAWFEDYSYGPNGLLANASVFWALDVDAKVNEYAYGYDGDGRLTQFALGSSEKGSDAKTFTQAGAFAYLDSGLGAFKDADSAIAFSMGDNGLMAAACKGDASSQTMLSCMYGSSGALSSYVSSYASLSGDVGVASHVTEYSEGGLPVSSTVPDGTGSMQVSYECNADGYINAIKWGGSDAYMAGGTGKLSYVKRVGALADRASERYVPVVRPALYVTDLFDMQGWSPLQNWFSSTGSELPITMLPEGPMSKAAEQLGTKSTMLMNPNELELFEYDREHWADGLALSGEQTIEAAGVSELLAKAAATPLPVPAQTFLNDPVYGEVVKQYVAAQKEANALGGSISSDSLDEYADIPPSVRMLMGTNATYSKTKVNVLDFAYVDLDEDGSNELAVTFPNYVQYATKAADGGSDVNVIAVYGHTDGKPQLIACGAERLQCWVTPGGHVVTYGGGAMYANIMVYAWSGTKAEVVGGLDYMTSAGDGTAGSFELTTYGADGSKKASVVDYDAVMEQLDAIMDANPYAQLAWTPIPMSALG